MRDRFDSHMILYRPVSLQELELIYDNGMIAFPARLPQQPIFYPVVQLEYARQIASDWNAKSGQSAGYVTQFKVEDDYINKFEAHTVGSSQHQEFWIPAEKLEEFNRHITGHIKVVEAHFGDAFQGFVPEKFGLQGKDAVEQFTLLANSYIYKRMDFYLEIKRNHKAVFLNYPFWLTYDFKNPGLKEKVLQAIKEGWFASFPKIPLPLPPPVREDAPLAGEPIDSDGEDLVDPVEEIASVEQTDSDSLTSPVQEEIKPARPTSSQSVANPVRQERPPAKPTESRSYETPVRKAITPATPIESQPVHKDVTPVKPANSHAPPLVIPVQKDTPLPRQTASLFAQGIKLGLSGKYEKAVDDLSSAVEEDPYNVVAHISLGVVFHQIGEDDRALTCYETALKLDPKAAEAHYFRANILYAHGNVREAIAGYTIAIGLSPELIEASEKHPPQDRLTDYSPSPAEMHRIARSARRILALNRALEANPRQANLFKERAAEYDRLWNYEQAIADYSSALALQPEDADLFHSRGVAYEQIGQHDRAREDYQQAIKINPQLSDMYINRGVTFGRMGNLRQSIASLTEGIRLAPQNPDGYFNRGTAYFQQGNLERAIEDFSSVIRLSLRDDAAYYWRGISNEEAGRREDAIADYRQFLTISQDVQVKEEIEKKLRRWKVGTQDSPSGQSIAPEDKQKTSEIQSKRPDHDLDLYALVSALGDRALDSIWLGSGVDCYGESAEEMLSFTDHNRSIEGQDFLRIAAGIQQTIEGDFTAFDPGATSHWIFIRAWEGSGFYIETNDPKSKERLKTHFQSVEEVEEVEPPYEGLFLRI